MPIAVDVMLARRKMSMSELAGGVGITPANLAVLKNGRAKAIEGSTQTWSPLVGRSKILRPGHPVRAKNDAPERPDERRYALA